MSGDREAVRCGRGICMAESGHEGTCDEASIGTPPTADAGGASLTDAERAALVSRIKWNLDHFGPLRDDGTPYSRFESPAHAAADAVYDWLAARASTAQDEGAGEVERLRAAVEALADEWDAEAKAASAAIEDDGSPFEIWTAQERAKTLRQVRTRLRAVVGRAKDGA